MKKVQRYIIYRMLSRPEGFAKKEVSDLFISYDWIVFNNGVIFHYKIFNVLCVLKRLVISMSSLKIKSSCYIVVNQVVFA
jgi:hypothetical protein